MTVPDGVLDKDGVLVRPRDEGRGGAWARCGLLYNINISASGLVTSTLSSDYLLRCLIELFVFSRRKRELLIQSRPAEQGKIISRIFLHGFLA